MSSLKDRIYQEILSRILRGEFALDELLAEKKLCELFGVSRSPVREALGELCREEILKSMPRAGYQIVRISERQMRDAFQMRLLLEMEGLERAFERLNDKRIAGLKEIAGESDQALRDEGPESLMRRLRLNDRFHMLLCSYGGNALLEEYLGRTLKLLHRGMAQHMIGEARVPDESCSIHGQLVEALEARDFERASRYLREDIYSMEQELWEVMV